MKSTRKNKRSNFFLKKKDGNLETQRETFHYIIKKFRRSGKQNYNFLTRAGLKFQNTVFNLIQRMFAEEIFPTVFQNTTLHMIPKGRTRRKEVLAENRFIHCKEWWPRAAEGLVVEDGIKGPLLAGSSIYQIGGQPGHRSKEHMFAFKSYIWSVYFM